jgi:hypothetical protein
VLSAHAADVIADITVVTSAGGDAPSSCETPQPTSPTTSPSEPSIANAVLYGRHVDPGWKLPSHGHDTRRSGLTPANDRYFATLKTPPASVTQ